MDRLRALEYFVAAAEEGSFSGAARRFEVSIPAVAKLVTSLEKRVGASFFVRGSQGLALTADGERYLETCRPLLERLAEADETVGAAAVKPRGEVVIGGPAFVLQNCLGPFLPRFHQRYPDIDLDLRIYNQVTEAEGSGVDLFVLFGWHDTPEFIQRPLAQSRYVVLASPDYWASHPPVQRPSDLARHECFAFRNPRGVLLDLWEFEKGGKKEAVKVRGWFSSNLRDMGIDAALGGQGIVRSNDLTTWSLIKSGRLQPALQDWNALHAPPANLVLRPNQRRIPRIRAVMDFAADVFRRLEAERPDAIVVPAERPSWYDRRYNRASSSLR